MFTCPRAGIPITFHVETRAISKFVFLVSSTNDVHAAAYFCACQLSDDNSCTTYVWKTSASRWSVPVQHLLEFFCALRTCWYLLYAEAEHYLASSCWPKERKKKCSDACLNNVLQAQYVVAFFSTVILEKISPIFSLHLFFPWGRNEIYGAINNI